MWAEQPKLLQTLHLLFWKHCLSLATIVIICKDWSTEQWQWYHMLVAKEGHHLQQSPLLSAFKQPFSADSEWAKQTTCSIVIFKASGSQPSFYNKQRPSQHNSKLHLMYFLQMELQQNYEMCSAELQSVELHQEVLLFQIECLQDALEGAEETLIETKREAHQISMVHTPTCFSKQNSKRPGSSSYQG